MGRRCEHHVSHDGARAIVWALLPLTLLSLGPSIGGAQEEPLESAPEPSADSAESTTPDARVNDPQPAAIEEPSAEAPERPVGPAARDEDPNTITIIGTRLSETSGSAHMIGEKKLARFEYDDASAVLLSVPGVYSRGEDGVGLRNNIGLRGVNPDRSKKVTLLEDGILFAPAPYSAPAAYYFPLITRMTGIEVLKGPAAIAHGPYTIAGAIDLATRDVPSDTSAYLDLAGGEYGYGKLHAYAGSTTSDKIGFLIEGVHVRNTGFKHLPGGGETGSIRNEWMGKLSYVLDQSSSITHEFLFKGTYSDEDSDETYLGLTDDDFRADPLQRYSASQLDHMVASRKSLVLTHTVEFSPEVSLVTNAYYNHYHRSWRRAKFFVGGDLYTAVVLQPMSHLTDILRGLASSTDLPNDYLYIGPNERDFHSMGLDTRLHADFKTGSFGHHIEAGARLHYDYIDRRHSEDAYLVGMDGSLTPGGLPTNVSTFEHVGALAFAGFVADSVSLGPVTLTPGVRIEVIEFGVDNHLIEPPADPRGTFNTSAVLPAVGAYVRLFEGFGVLGGVSRGFSPPIPPTWPVADAASLAESPLDPPELSVNYEAGARYMLRSTRLEAIGFFNDYGNLTDVCTASSGCADMMSDMQFNAGRARIYGIEAFAEHSLSLGPVRIPMVLSYTFTRGTFEESFTSDDPIFGDVQAGDFMPYLPEHQLRASLGVENERFAVEFGVMYMSSMREEAGSEPIELVPVRTDPQTIFDVGLTVHINDWWSAYGNLRNVFNELVITGHRPFGAKVNAPRWLQIGTKLTY